MAVDSVGLHGAKDGSVTVFLQHVIQRQDAMTVADFTLSYLWHCTCDKDWR